MSEIRRQITDRLKAIGDPLYAKHSQSYFKTGKDQYAEGDLFLGIRVPVLRALAKELKATPVADAFELLRSTYHEARLLALFILTRHFEKGGEALRKTICEGYLSSTAFINNWDLVDSSAHKILGAYLYDKKADILTKLARSEDLWERRIAVISTFYFISKERYADSFAISEILLHDTHDLIHKAVGWVLREIGNRDRSAEEAFLIPRYRSMPRTMLRYAIEKFPEPLRQRYLKGEIEPREKA